MDQDIIITGGGMVGLSAAIALAKRGLRVTVLERSAMPAQLEAQFDGRVSAIALGSKHFLESIGAWDGMRDEAEPIRDIRVSDGNSKFFVHYDHRDIGDAPFGYIVENRYIRHALQEAAAKHPTLNIREQVEIVSFASDAARARVTLNNGETLSAKLVLAADGKFSAIRELAGIGTLTRDYRQTAIVATIGHERSHEGLAQERFLSAGPFAVLPMTGNRSSLVWVEPRERAPIYLRLSKEECEQEISERVGDYLGRITLLGDRFAYPLSLSHAKEYVGERLALIGDAAHSIHPIAGQGVNLGFRDAAVIDELASEGLEPGGTEMLARYQRWRRFDNVSMMAVTDGLNSLFAANILPVKLARGLGMWGVNRMPGLKKFFMKHAMGLVGDLPKSLKA